MLKKRYIKSRDVCQVAFELPAAELPEGIEVECVHLAGDFNDWNPLASPMKRNTKNVYRIALNLEPGRTYQFRYVANSQHWFNAWQADAYIPNHMGEDNCVVTTLSGKEPA